ncbi:hypothetical protein SESBI_27812 [Sesbania bispinosa]|nr:hypothetical protein SESBI_27812 [Sesbania bispinosa]
MGPNLANLTEGAIRWYPRWGKYKRDFRAIPTDNEELKEVKVKLTRVEEEKKELEVQLREIRQAYEALQLENTEKIVHWKRLIKEQGLTENKQTRPWDVATNARDGRWNERKIEKEKLETREMVENIKLSSRRSMRIFKELGQLKEKDDVVYQSKRRWFWATRFANLVWIANGAVEDVPRLLKMADAMINPLTTPEEICNFIEHCKSLMRQMKQWMDFGEGYQAIENPQMDIHGNVGPTWEQPHMFISGQQTDFELEIVKLQFKKRRRKFGWKRWRRKLRPFKVLAPMDLSGRRALPHNEWTLGSPYVGSMAGATYRDFADLIAAGERIEILARAGKLPTDHTEKNPVRPMEPPFPAWYNPNLTCKFHMGVAGHSIEDCEAFKTAVRKLIACGRLDIQEERGPNIVNNPIPNHERGNQANAWRRKKF